MSGISPIDREIRGIHVLVGIVAFFLAVATVDAVMIYRAVSTFSGTDTQDAYRKGLAYNARIAEEGVQNARDWRTEHTFDAATGAFRVTIKDRTGSGVDGLAVAARIGRPATSQFDRDLALKSEGSGVYAATIDGLSDGTWVMVLDASYGDAPQNNLLYRAKVRLWKQP